jgi:cyclopropane fatty-acyl-phospholipid synthase-like methyltransferase
MNRVLTMLLATLLGLAGCQRQQDSGIGLKNGLVAPYVTTPPKVVDAMLELAEVTKDDVLYDLGCGDGRIVIAAAKKYGCRAVGVELDPERVKEARDNLGREKLDHLVTIVHDDIFRVDLSPATVVTLYLFEEVNLKLKPILRRSLKPGSRVVSHHFNMGDWQPLKRTFAKDESDVAHKLFLWKIE